MANEKQGIEMDDWRPAVTLWRVIDAWRGLLTWTAAEGRAPTSDEIKEALLDSDAEEVSWMLGPGDKDF
jgi:hypothetical protein